MKVILLLLVGLAAFVAAEPGLSRPNLGQVRPPPFINRPRPPPQRRFRRSADPQGSVVFTHTKPLDGPERRPSYNLDYQHKIFDGKDGHISATGGAQRLPGRNWEPSVGVQGTWRFRRSADPQGSVVFTHTKPLDGPERRPSYNLDYQHKIFDGKDGHISATGGAQRLPGRNWEPSVGVQGTWRFRRSADPQGSIVLQGQQPLSGPDRRPSYNLEYQHNIFEGKNGHVSAGGGAQKLPGQRWEPHVGIQGTWRFRRSADPQGSIVLQGQQPLSGPDRRPSYNLEYQHNIFEGKNGHVSAGGGAQKLPGQRWEPHVGIQGTWRFRRSADPQGSIVLQGQQPLSGPDRRPSYNLEYQHNIFEGKNGHVSAGGGAQKLPGQRWEPHVGIQGTWRFRRSADPQGSIVLQGRKPLEGPDRRPSYNIEYQHKIYEGKNGHVSAGGGAQKMPGQRWEPQVGVQATWNY